MQRLVLRALLLLALLDRLFEARDLVHEARGFGFVFGLLGLADVLGGGVAAGLRLLQNLNRFAALLVQTQDLSQQIARRVEGALLKPFDEGLWVLTDPFDVKHGGTSLSSTQEFRRPPYKARSGRCHGPLSCRGHDNISRTADRRGMRPRQGDGAPEGASP